MKENISRRKIRKSRRQKEFLHSILFFIIVIASIAGLLSYLWVYNEINITLQDMTALEKIRESVIAENKKLESEIALLERSDRITNLAKEKLNMVAPEPESLVVFVEPKYFQNE